MTAHDPVQLDTWSALNHKSTMQGLQRIVPDSGMAPTWVGDHQRRLNAYITLDAYLRNVARSWIMSADRDHRREYGDAALIRDTIRGAVLGDGFELALDGTEWDAPPEPGESATDDEREHYAVEFDHWQRVTRQQNWMDRWTAIEQMQQKIIHAENNTVGLGDCVYVLSWSNAKNRVRVRTYDPGFYFPVYGDHDDDYPEKVHVAWEFEEMVGGTLQRFVRRLTWEIIDDGVTRTYPYPSTADELILEDIDNIHARSGHAAPATAGTDPAGDSTSTSYCAMSDGVWRVADIKSGQTVADLSPGDARWQLNADGEVLDQYDIGIDFIPVIHVPNTVNLEEHYGESSLLRIAQLLDDLQAADSDLASASALVGTPPMMISGWEGQEQVSTYGPGSLFGVADGDMKILDTSRSLDALIAHVADLLARLAVNRQIPDAILGRVDASDVPSGVSLLLSFGPFRQHIAELRLARTEKYCLLMKFVQRLGRVGGVLDAVYPGCVRYGSYLPSDLQSVVAMVETLVQGDSPVLSKATALRMLQDAGVDIEDVEIELQRVRAEDFKGAQAIADATADEGQAREYLGIIDGDPVGDEAGGVNVAPVPIPDEDLPQP